MGKAILVKALKEGLGHDTLYKLEPSYMNIEYVLVMSVASTYAHEVAVFEAKENGDVVSYKYLARVKGTHVHDVALKELGYEITKGEINE